VLLLATPYVPFPIGIAPHQPVMPARDEISTLQPPFSSQPSAQLVCTLCIILSMRNANHSSPTSHWCTSVKAALKLAKLQNVVYTCPLQSSQSGRTRLSRPRKCQFPLAIRILPRGNVTHRVFDRYSSCKEKSITRCPLADSGLLQPVDMLLTFLRN
jgi:hypothetical protein